MCEEQPLQTPVPCPMLVCLGGAPSNLGEPATVCCRCYCRVGLEAPTAVFLVEAMWCETGWGQRKERGKAASLAEGLRPDTVAYS